MSSDIDPTVPIFKTGSRAERISHRAVAISIVLFVATLILCGVAIAKGTSWGIVVAGLALFWAVGAPAWFWFEYFFLYRMDGEKGSFELYKHGHQVSIAIWAGLAVSLGALANSDMFKEKAQPTDSTAATGIAAQAAISPPTQQRNPPDRQPATPAAAPKR